MLSHHAAGACCIQAAVLDLKYSITTHSSCHNTGPAHRPPLVHVNAAGAPHHHFDHHRHSHHRNGRDHGRGKQQQQQQQQCQQVAQNEHPFAAGTVAAAPVSEPGSSTVAEAAAQVLESGFGEANEAQLQELEALEVTEGPQYSTGSSGRRGAAACPWVLCCYVVSPQGALGPDTATPRAVHCSALVCCWPGAALLHESVLLHCCHRRQFMVKSSAC